MNELSEKKTHNANSIDRECRSSRRLVVSRILKEEMPNTLGELALMQSVCKGGSGQRAEKHSVMALLCVCAGCAWNGGSWTNISNLYEVNKDMIVFHRAATPLARDR